MKSYCHVPACVIAFSFIGWIVSPSTSSATPPVALCKNATLAAGANCNAELAIADIDNGSFDPDGDPFFLSFNPPGPFNKGKHTVTLTATDNQGGSASCTAEVTVSDRTDPVVLCPADIDIDNIPGQCAATASYPQPVIQDNCPGPYSTTYSRASGSRFDVGTNDVVATVIDNSGNDGTCVLKVIVNDAESPVLTTSCPDPITVQAEKDQTTVTVAYNAPATTDNCGISDITCEPPSGFAFPIGDTPVVCTATDMHENATSCGFSVTVLAPEGLQTLDDMIEFIEQLGLAKGAETSLVAKLRAAQRATGRQRDNAAANQISAFIHESQAMKKTGRIDPESADELIEAATDIIDQLESARSRQTQR